MQRRYIIIYTLSSLTALALVVTISLIACNGTAKTGLNTDLQPRAVNDTWTISNIVPLDDPSNPYAGQYEAWDHWIYEHLTADPEPRYRWEKHPDEMTKEELEDFVFGRSKPSNWLHLKISVEDGKYTVPLETDLHEFEKAVCENRDKEREASIHWVHTQGTIDERLREDIFTLVDKVRAQYLEPIPEWLAEGEPRFAMLLPEGWVVTEGLLQTDKTTNSNNKYCCGGNDTSYSLYSPEGKLTRTAKWFWWLLFYDIDINGMPDGDIVNTADGYIKLLDKDSGELLQVWDWDATPLAIEEPTPRDRHPFYLLSGKDIASLYAASSDGS